MHHRRGARVLNIRDNRSSWTIAKIGMSDTFTERPLLPVGKIHTTTTQLWDNLFEVPPHNQARAKPYLCCRLILWLCAVYRVNSVISYPLSIVY